MGNNYKRMIMAALLTALCIVMGLLFINIPNVEMITATVFISGVITGALYGAIIGLVAQTFYSVFNPYGMPLPTMLVAQMIAFTLIGLVGGLLRKKVLSSSLRILYCATAGLILTLIYDVLTTFSFIITMPELNIKAVMGVFASGLLFYATHIGVNTLIFALVVPVILVRLKPHLGDYLQI